MSVVSEITRLKNAKAAVKAAIEEKGVSVGEGTLDTYAAKIGQIATTNQLVPLIEGTMTSFTFPAGITSIKYYLFYGSAIETIAIPEGVTKIQEQTFGYSALRNISLPESIVQLDYGAFLGCNWLKSITVPAGVATIAENALNFAKSDQKGTIIMKPTTPPTIQSKSIGAYIGKIIVPAEALTAYREATNWAAYTSIIEADAPVETWIIDETPTGTTDSIYESVRFLSGGEVFTSFIVSESQGVTYLNTSGEEQQVWSSASGWTDEKYRTVGFFEPVGDQGSSLSEWLQSNAAKSVETWVLNDEPNVSSAATFTVPFLANGKRYTSLSLTGNNLVYTTDDGTLYDIVYTVGSGWSPNKATCGTLILGEEPASDLLAWLQDNGTKQEGE